MFQVNEQMCKKYLTVSINESYGRPWGKQSLNDTPGQ